MTSDPVTKVRLFGEPAVGRGEDLVVLTRKPAALLGALVLAGPAGLHTDQLADALWPGPMPKTYETALRVHVMKLRRLLGDEDAELLVRRRQGGYALDRAVVDVDIDRFTGLAQRCLRAAGSADLSETSATAAAALALWTDDPFRGLEDVAGAVATRTGLESTLAQICEAFGDSGVRLGRADQVIDVLEPIHARRPAEERVALPLLPR